MDGFLPKDMEFMSLERILVNRGEKWKRVKMKTKWEEMQLMRPHAYMHTDIFCLQQGESEIFQKLFTVSQMRLSAQGPITFRRCDKLGLKAQSEYFSFM